MVLHVLSTQLHGQLPWYNNEPDAQSDAKGI